MGKREKKKIIKTLIGLIILIIIAIIGIFNPNLQKSIKEFLGIEKSVSMQNGKKIQTISQTDSFDLNSIPKYENMPFVYINDNKPNFTEADYTTKPFEKYSELDSLGRCSVAYANICKELMPSDNEKRQSISDIYPTGWINVKYDGVIDGGYLYNRSHLIGWQLAGENANEKNLITGTRYMNVEGMLPFENLIDDYFEDYANVDNHVLYRVTPIFEGDNLVASGVQMEAYSVEDKGEGICFNVYVYNVQPGIEIDYKTGKSMIKQ